jgi:quercetin dioxygenase-like cupin family protein
MKIISSVLLLLVVSYSSFAQFDAKTVGALSPKEAYRNIKVIPLHSDTNSSVYLIFIKQAVKKHLHAYHTEVVTVLEGSARMYLGGETLKIAKGDHIIIPPNTAHAVITTSKKPLKVLSVQSPQFLGKDRIFIEDK